MQLNMDESGRPTNMELLCRKIDARISGQACREWSQQAMNHCVKLLVGDNEPFAALWKCIKHYIYPDRSPMQHLAPAQVQIPVHPTQIAASECVSLLDTFVAEYTYCVTNAKAVQLWNDKLLGSVVVILAATAIILFVMAEKQLKKVTARYSKPRAPEKTFSDAKQTQRDYLDANLRNVKQKLRRLGVSREDLALADGRKMLVLKMETRQQFAKAILQGRLTKLRHHDHLLEWNAKRYRCAMARNMTDWICRSDTRVLHVAIVLELEQRIEQGEIERALQRHAAKTNIKKCRNPPACWSRAVNKM